MQLYQLTKALLSWQQHRVTWLDRLDSYVPYQSQEMEMPESIDLVSDRLKDAVSSTEINRLNQQTEKLSERTIDKRLVRLEVMVEISQKQLPKN